MSDAAKKLSVTKGSRWIIPGFASLGHVWVCVETGRGGVILSREDDRSVNTKTSAAYVLRAYTQAPSEKGTS